MAFPFKQIIGVINRTEGQSILPSGTICSRIGIQAAPGALFKINDQYIRISERGYYELTYTVTSVMGYTQGSYILDYKEKTL